MGRDTRSSESPVLLIERARQRLGDWVERELASSLELAPLVVARTTGQILGVAEKWGEHASTLPQQSRREDVVRSWMASHAADAVACARATSRWPLGATWWRQEGQLALRYLFAGKPNEAIARVAEALAGPFDVDVDFNWPARKLFGNGVVPEELAIGTVLIAGDGEGSRAQLEVVEREGQRGFEKRPGSDSHPTAELQKVTHREARALADLPAR